MIRNHALPACFRKCVERMVLDSIFVTAPILNSDFQIEAIPKDDLLLPERRRDLQKEVELARRNLAQQVSTPLIYRAVSDRGTELCF